MSKETPAHKYKTEDHVTTHMVTLTNGEILLLTEDPRNRELGIALGLKEYDFVVDVHICTISANGVQVLPNSGHGPETLSDL
jgi:hypothetical protein